MQMLSPYKTGIHGELGAGITEIQNLLTNSKVQNVIHF